jgi:glycerol-3-phosphate dehydrogenase
MNGEARKQWGSIAIVAAVLVLAVSIIYVGTVLTGTVQDSMNRFEGEMTTTVVSGLEKGITQELKDELVEDIRREVLAAVYAYRSGAQHKRELTREDIEAGYRFADEYLEGMR